MSPVRTIPNVRKHAPDCRRDVLAVAAGDADALDPVRCTRCWLIRQRLGAETIRRIVARAVSEREER